jgi:hypothetical protein
MCDKSFTHLSWVTSSYFGKYFCDTHCEYITPSAVMTYATFYAIRVTPLRLLTLRSGARVWFDGVDNMADNSQKEID